MRSVLPVLMLVALALGGCTQAGGGGGATNAKDFSGEEAKVAGVVSDLADDGSKRKPDAICNDLLASSLQQQIASAGSKCVTEMRKAIEDADGFDLKVADVSVDGKRARAQVKSTGKADAVTRTFAFVAEGGKWRISSFGK